MIITFCGHGKYFFSEEEKKNIKEYLLKLVDKYPLAEFYLGGYGNFDWLIFHLLKDFQKDFPKIKIIFITPYLDEKYSKLNLARKKFDSIIYPELENVPKKFAIIERNKWMVDKSNFVVAFVKYSFGGARKTLDYAIKKQKPFKNLS